MVGIEGFKGQEQEKRQSSAKTEYVGVNSSKFYKIDDEADKADAELDAALYPENNGTSQVSMRPDGDPLRGYHTETPSSLRVATYPEGRRPYCELIEDGIDDTIRSNKNNILNAANEFGVDKYTVAAIIYQNNAIWVHLTCLMILLLSALILL